MPDDRQAMRAGKSPQEGLHSTSAAPPRRRHVATLFSRVECTAGKMVNMHNDAPAVPQVSTCLLDLPNELLDIVALHLCGSKSILELSCINKRFRRIAQYAMLRNLCVPRDGLTGALQRLAVDPNAVFKVCHLDLGKCRHSKNNHGRAQLVAILPSLKVLTIWLAPHGDAFKARPLVRSPNHQHHSIVPIQVLALKPVQERVQILNILSDPRYKQSAAQKIKLPGFHNLLSLTISMEHLGVPNMISFYRPDGSWIEARQGSISKHPCLPLSLKSLHLTSCTRNTFALLHIFDNLGPGDLHLRHITLAFDMPTVPAIVLCSTSHTKLDSLQKKASRWLRRLNSLAYKDHRVSILTTESVSFTEELKAATKLSNSELALAAGKALRLSDCVARNLGGSRVRSSVECRLFLLHGHRYLHLFCSPTFDVSQWTEVVFFHGERGVSSKSPRMTYTFRYATPRGRDHVLTANPSLDIPLSTTAEQVSSPHPDPASDVALEKAVSSQALSKTRRSNGDRHDRDVTYDPTLSSLIFNGKETEPPRTQFDLLSKFAAADFMYENWIWYLQPPEASAKMVGRERPKLHSAHNDSKDDNPGT